MAQSRMILRYHRAFLVTIIVFLENAEKFDEEGVELKDVKKSTNLDPFLKCTSCVFK